MFAKYDITLYGNNSIIKNALANYEALEQAVVTKKSLFMKKKDFKTICFWCAGGTRE